MKNQKTFKEDLIATKEQMRTFWYGVATDMTLEKANENNMISKEDLSNFLSIQYYDLYEMRGKCIEHKNWEVAQYFDGKISQIKDICNRFDVGLKEL